jgi:hypothetical protein
VDDFYGCEGYEKVTCQSADWKLQPCGWSFLFCDETGTWVVRGGEGVGATTTDGAAGTVVLMDRCTIVRAVL